MNHSPKRILIFSLAYYPRYIGGAEVAVKEITDRIDPKMYEFDMVTLDPEGPRYEKIGNVHVYRIGGRWIHKVVFLGKLYKYIFIFQAFYKACVLHRKRRYDGIWSIMANYAGFAALFFKLQFPRVPFLLTLQEGDPIAYIKRRVAIVYPLFVLIFKKADRIQAISRYLADIALSLGFTKKPVVVPNGVSINHFSVEISGARRIELRSTYGLSPDDVVLCTASRLVIKNAVGDIIDALAFLPSNYKLVIAGVGELEPILRQKASQYGSRVLFMGFVPHSDLPSVFALSDVFVRPSLSEGLGNAFLEAMAAKLPVVATDVGGIKDFLFDMCTGLVCEPANPKSIAEKVKMLSDESLRKTIIEQAHILVVTLYDWNQIASHIEHEFTALTSHARVAV